MCNIYLCNHHYRLHVDDCVEKYLNAESADSKDEEADDGGWMHQDSEPEESAIEAILRAHRSRANVKDLIEKEEEAWSDVEMSEAVKGLHSDNRVTPVSKKDEDIDGEWEEDLYPWENYVRAEVFTQEDEVIKEPEEDPVQTSIEECFLGTSKKSTVHNTKTCAIIDSGCTSTCAGEDTLNNYVKEAINCALGGPWSVDTENKRVFRFADMKLHEALCTAIMPFRLSKESQICGLKMSVMPSSTPILMSCDVMKKMGALINFGTGEVIFLRISKTLLYQLPRAHNGHLLLPLLGALRPHRVLETSVGYTLCRMFAGHLSKCNDNVYTSVDHSFPSQHDSVSSH